MALLLQGENWNEIMGRDVMVKLHSRLEYAEDDPLGQTAQMGSSVTCNMKCFFMKQNPDESDGKDELVRASDAPFETLTAQTFKIGEADAVPALELALRHSKAGDRLTLRATNRFAYGPAGRPALISSASSSSSPAIPPQADLEFDIEIIKILGDRAIDLDLLVKVRVCCM